ncbi:hypothetical protein TanjilG_28954 [Lupinus angustifolius]|uniref:Uncharacterized protein n=1 Tax=Lupinus angustifolius TaxID=3871 RepID=A0A4P1RSS5_LUPAN|nr:hypothetical protein TanjilG_28954 [Lupinus angustifolius]
MSSDSVSNAETTSITQPISPKPEPQPQLQPSSMILSGKEESLSSILSQPLNNPNPNHRTLCDYGLSVGPGGFRLVDSSLNPVPSPNHRTLRDYGLSVGPGGLRLVDSSLNPVPSPNHRTLRDYGLSVGPGGLRLVDSSLNPVPSPNHRTLRDYGLSVGPGGLRLVDSSLNPVLSFGSLSLDPNPTQIVFSHGLGFSKLDDVLTEKPVELVEGSEKKEKAKVTFQLLEGTKGSVSGSDVSAEGEALGLCGEESNLKTKEDEGEGKKTWNLRPRKEKKVAKSGTTNGSGGRRSVVQDSSQTKMPTRTRTPRSANSTQGSGPSVFSLTLTKSEIEEDFLKMTGQLPPKKPQRRSRNVQKHIDVTIQFNLDFINF